MTIGIEVMIGMLVILCILFSICCVSVPVQANTKLSTISINGEFPIGFWWPPPERHTNLERYREIAEAGFTFTMGGNSIDSKATNEKILTYADSLGMTSIILDKRLYNLSGGAETFGWVEVFVDAVLRDYSKFPSFGGLMLMDEPGVKQFPVLGHVTKLLLEKKPYIIPYVNLFPNYASPQQLGVSSYEVYVCCIM